MAFQTIGYTFGNSSNIISNASNVSFEGVKNSINYYGFVYTSLLFIIGLPGNILVFFVYSKKTRKNSTTVFILVLALFDLINCTVTLPTEIVMLLNPFVFHIGPVCKMSRFTTYTCNSSAAVILAAIAVDRYKRVCKPHGEQITLKRARYMTGVAFIMAVSFTWPSLVIYGPRTINVLTENKNISLKVCEIDDGYVVTVYPLVYYSYMCFSTCGIYFILLVSYISIVVKMLKRRNFSSLILSKSVYKSTVPDIHIENPSSHVPDNRDTAVVNVSSAHGSTKSLNVCCRTDESNLFQYGPVVIKDTEQKRSNVDDCIATKESPHENGNETNDHTIIRPNILNVDNGISCQSKRNEDISLEIQDYHKISEKNKNEDLLSRKSITVHKQVYDSFDLINGSEPDATPQNVSSNITYDKGKCAEKTRALEVGDREKYNRKYVTKTYSLDVPLTNQSNDQNSSDTVNSKIHRHSISKIDISENNDRKRSRSPSYTGEISLNGSNKSRMRPSKRSLRTHRLGKTTLMLLVVTIVYIVSFLPFLAVVIQRSINPAVPLTYDGEYDTVYEALYRSYLLNCAINPIIYSFFNANFRKDCSAAFRRRKYYRP